MFSYTKGLVLLVLVGCTYAYPSGAPSSICGRYAPGHRNENTNVNNPPQGPFRMDVTPMSGGQYRVTLRATGGTPFKGFLIQGMQSNPTWKRFPEGAADIVGTFQPSQDMNSFMPRRSQLRRCTGMAGANVITHIDSSPKTSVTVTWTPPRMGGDPNYKLLATVVRDSNTFYVVQSDVISTGGASSQATSGTSSGASVTTSLPAQAGDQTVTSSTGSSAGTSFLNPGQGSGSFLTPNQGSGSFMFPAAGSGMSSQAGMNVFSADANTLTDASSTNLAVPSGSFFSSQDSGFSSPTSGFSSQDLGISSQGSFFSGQGAGFSSPGSAFSSPGSAFSSPGSGFSSQDSGFNSMTGMSRIPGATPLPIIPNNVNFPRNFPTISGPSSEMSSLSNLNINGSSETVNFTEPFFTANGSQMNLGIEFIGQDSFNASALSNDTSILSDAMLSLKSNSILFSDPTAGFNSTTGQNFTAANISSEFAVNPPVALEMVEIPTRASERISPSTVDIQPLAVPTVFQPPNTVQNFEYSNITSTNISFRISPNDPAMSNQQLSTLGPSMGSSTYDPYWDNSSYPNYWDNSSFDPFYDLTTTDPNKNASTPYPVLLPNISESSNSLSFVNVFQPQPPITTNPIQPPNPGMQFLPPTTVNTFRDPNVVTKPRESSTVIPFQAPTKPKPIEIPMPVEPIIPAASPNTQTPPPTISPLQIPTTISPLSIPTTPLPSILPVVFEEPPPKTIPFYPPTVPESLFPTANEVSNSISVEPIGLSEQAFEEPPPKTILFEQPTVPESLFSTSIDASNSVAVEPIGISEQFDSVSKTIAVDSLTVQEMINSLANDSSLTSSFNSVSKTVSIDSLNVPEIINSLANDSSLTVPFTLSTNLSSENPPVNDSLMSIRIDTPTTKESLEPLATYDPLAPPPPIFNPESFPTPVTFVNAPVTDSITVPITRPVASIDLPIKIDSPTIKSLPTGDVRVVLKSPATVTTEFRPETLMPEPVLLSSSSSPTFEVVSTSLSDVMGSVDVSDNTATGLGERPTLRVEPLVNVINVPVPSGQIAAVLNFSRTAGATVPPGIPPLSVGSNRFVTIGRPLGQFGGQPGSFGATMFGQQSSGGRFGAPQFRGGSSFGQRTSFPRGPARRPMTFGSQGQFGGSFGGPRRTMGPTGAGAGSFGFQRFASPMPSGFVGAGSQFGGQGSFAGQSPSFMGQGSVRQFRFGPQGSQTQTVRFPPQQGQFTTFRFGSNPGQFSRGSVRTLGSGSLQGQGQSGTGFSSQTFGQTGGSSASGQGGTGFSTQTFGQTGGSSSSGFLTPVGL